MNRDEGKALLISMVLLAMLFSPIVTSLFINPIPIVDDLDDDDENPLTNPKLSAVTASQIYNVSYVNMTYGHNTTVLWESESMRASDGTNGSFIEDKYTITPTTILGDTATDSATNWEAYYRMDNL